MVLRVTLLLALSTGAAVADETAGPWIRVNQVGYLPGDPKIAVLSSDRPLSGAFSVGDFRGDIGPDLGAWGPFRHNYRLDFTAFGTPGRYRVRFGGVDSLAFKIGDDAYQGVTEKLMDFIRLQRCGDNPVTGEKCHQQDAIDTTTGRRIDLVGGWHDAADRIKHMITTTYGVAALQLAQEEAEARYGGELVKKIHPDENTIYIYDDLEWAATELYLLTRKPACLEQAVAYADQAGENPWMGKDRHGHYEFFPYVNLAHWRLYPHADRAAQGRLAGYYRAGLQKVQDRADNPYRLGTPLVWCSTNDVIALATQAVLYEQMTGDRQFRMLAAEARDWIFGRNPWGVSMVVGVPGDGVAASRPHHLFYRLKGIVPVGGLVDGPVYRDINDSLKFEPFPDDAFARFQSDVAVYRDCFEDFSTNEPILDGTVSLLLLLKIWQ